MRVAGEKVGQLVLDLGHLQLGLRHRGLVAGTEPAGVVEQRGHVPGPQRRERLGRVGAELGREQLAEGVGVLADRGVRGLGQVRVVADPAAHHVRREHGVLAEQGLELQRELARGDRTAGRLGPGQAAVGAAVGVAGAGREGSGLDRRAAGRGGGGRAFRPRDTAGHQGDGDHRRTEQEQPGQPAASPARFAHCKNPHTASPNRSRDRLQPPATGCHSFPRVSDTILTVAAVSPPKRYTGVLDR